MCYNITYLEKRAYDYHERYKDLLPEAFALNDAAQFSTYYHVSGFAHPQLPIVNKDGIFEYQWGLIPANTRNATEAATIQNMTLNFVTETVFEKKSFKNVIMQQRCLLGVNGFFESRDVNTLKYPYHIKLKNESIFSLGCIYDTWVDEKTGEVRNTFSIGTTPANPMMEKIHNVKKRMPLIIDRSNEKDWINPALNKEEIKELMKPLPEELMEAYSVGKFVNNSRSLRNVPEALAEVEYVELPSI